MASKKPRGLSLEEKRKRMCDFFYEKKDFFQLKELEKQLPKSKGIVMQSVKDVLQSLVDDRLVQAEKIGTSNYFWSFPSTALQSRMTQKETLAAELHRLRQAQSELTDLIERAAASREGGAERDALARKLMEEESKNRQYTTELEQFKEMDPDLFEAKKREMLEAKQAVERWTDNIYTIQSYCVNNFGIGRMEFCQQFGIPEDLDYE